MSSIEIDAFPTEPTTRNTVNIKDEIMDRDVLSSSPTSVNSFMQYREDQKTDICYSAFLKKEKTDYRPASEGKRSDRKDITTFFICIKETSEFQWRRFAIQLGYDGEKMVNYSEDKKDAVINKCRYEISKLKYRADHHLFWALRDLKHQNELRQKLKEIFKISGTPPEPSKLEKETLTEMLNKKGDLATDPRAEEFGELLNYICSGLTKDELKLLKTYLQTTKKVGKAAIEKICDNLDLMTILQERDLIRIDDVSYFNRLLQTINRNDLKRKVQDYEQCQPIQHDSTDITPGMSHLIDRENDMLISIRIIEEADQKIVEEIGRCFKEITDMDEAIKTIERDQLENEKSITSKDQQIGSINKQISELKTELDKLQTEKMNLAEVELSLNDKKTKTESLKVKSKRKVDELERLQKKECEMKKFSEKELKKIRQEMEQNHQRNQSKFTEKVETDAASSDDRHPNTVSKDYRKQHCVKVVDNDIQDQPSEPACKKQQNEVKQTSHKQDTISTVLATQFPPGHDENQEPNLKVQRQFDKNNSLDEDCPPSPSSTPTTPKIVSSTKILILTAEEDNKYFDDFMNDVKDTTGHTLSDLVTVQTLNQNMLGSSDLESINKVIEKSKLLLLLLSTTFTKTYWKPVSSLSSFNTALYFKKPLVVPVHLESKMNIPMGLKSATPLYFHRRDCYYRKALKTMLVKYKDT